MAIERRVAAGATDVSVIIRILDATDGTPETGVTSATAGLALEYRREGAASTAITESNLASLTAAHSDGGMFHIGNGYYRVDIPDAAFTAGAAGVLIHGTATGMVVDGAYVHIGPAIADVTHWLGTAAATPHTAGHPMVTIKQGTGTGEMLLTSGNPGLSVSTISSIADVVWDEPMADHVTIGSMGAGQYYLRSGQAQGGASTTITLDASASASNDFYNNSYIYILSGTGAGQSRFITDYDGGTKVATVASWVVNPDATSVFVIKPFGSLPGATAPTAAEVADAVWDEARSAHVAAGSFGQMLQAATGGTAQGGSSSSITLHSGASSSDNLYRYNIVQVIGGTGAGQSRQITGYTGSSKVATVEPAWAVNPDATSVFVIHPLGVDAATVAAIADAVWDEPRVGHQTAGTFGEFTNANITQISDDAVAAANAEAFFDGTGYAGTNNTIPTVGVVSGAVGSVAGNVGGNVVGSVGSVTGNVGGNVTGSVGSVVGNVGGNVVGSVGSVVTKTGYELSNTGIDALFNRQLTEGYNTDGSAPTVSQALHGILQFLTESSISGTTLTVRRLDGTTTAMTLTLNDASNPTSITRST